MKRYKIEYGFLIDTETNEILGYPYNEYIDADIAQELYDALEVLMQEWDKHDGHLVSHYHSTIRPKIERAKESLAKANKE